ncbi:unnamed protein product [Pleuronectes platessa]|uniref:Uncharacterized protein n=1 Tax=Pleuronectes platessa TaxID=8262 RepID=A0A9N7UH50_PLEPL|nr:unnamed protein product [Pleuronectes platessa]
MQLQFTSRESHTLYTAAFPACLPLHLPPPFHPPPPPSSFSSSSHVHALCHVYHLDCLSASPPPAAHNVTPPPGPAWRGVRSDSRRHRVSGRSALRENKLQRYRMTGFKGGFNVKEAAVALLAPLLMDTLATTGVQGAPASASSPAARVITTAFPEALFSRDESLTHLLYVFSLSAHFPADSGRGARRRKGAAGSRETGPMSDRQERGRRQTGQQSCVMLSDVRAVLIQVNPAGTCTYMAGVLSLAATARCVPVSDSADCVLCDGVSEESSDKTEQQ